MNTLLDYGPHVLVGILAVAYAVSVWRDAGQRRRFTRTWSCPRCDYEVSYSITGRLAPFAPMERLLTETAIKHLRTHATNADPSDIDIKEN